MKKYDILFGIVIIGVLLFAACDIIIDTPDENNYGLIGISFAGGENAARTVFPSSVFDRYVYTFTKEGETAGVEKTPNTSGLFTLEIGTYTVEVQAYIGEEEPYTLVASGVSLPFDIESGDNDPVVVLLSGINTGEKGNFTYTITLPAEASAEITLQQWSDMDNSIPLTPGTETLELESGSYLLTILVRKEYFYAGLIEAVYIYPEITTEYTKVFTDDDMLDGSVTNVAEWEAALAAIKNGGDGTVENPKTYTITVTGSFNVPGSTENTFGDVSNASITLNGNGTLRLSGRDSGSLLNIDSNQTVYIDSGELRMTSYRVSNRAVISVNGGILELRDGTINDNSAENGGGVYVADNGTFIMSGGVISGNTAQNGGGVYVSDNGTLTKSGGIIYGNDAATTTLRNTANSSKGHVVYWNTGVSLPTLWHNTTLNTNNDISTDAPDIVWVADATALTVETWANGNIPANGEQWFRFTATADTQYIHASFTTLNDLNVALYDSDGNEVGSTTRLNSGNRYISHDVTTGQVYYVKVTPYGSGSGTYQLTFNTLWIPPGAVTLSANTWTNGNIPANSEQWFRFTATADTQYIHASFTTLNDLNVALYDSGGNEVRSVARLNSGNRHIFQDVTIGEEYYVRITPYSSGNSGTYQLRINTSWISPGTVVTTLPINTWVNGNIPANDEQWFSFTAAADTQYIYAGFNTLTDLNVALYDSDGNEVENSTRLYSGNVYISCDVTIEQVYYVKVTPYTSGNSGTYQLRINTTLLEERTVTFNANGATSGTVPAAMTVLPGLSITLPNQGTLSRTGYTFRGWNTNMSGTGYHYITSFTPSNNIILYASWEYTAPGAVTNPIPLSSGVWYEGEITSHGEVWFRLTVPSGGLILIYWQDNSINPSLYTVRARLQLYSGSTLLSEVRGDSFTVMGSHWVDIMGGIGSTLDIRVSPLPGSGRDTGTFRIGFGL